MPLEIGADAPDFEKKDQEGNAVSLSSFRGEKAVALVFYPFTFTGVCEGELCQLRDDYSEYEDAGMQIIAMSCDSGPAQKKWAAEMGYQFPVLSDFWPHGEVAKAYGIFNEDLGCATRGTFIIGKDGKIVDVFTTASLGEARDKANYTAALTKI